MKQAIILCALILCFTQNMNCCTVEHSENIGSLQLLSSELRALISKLKKELNCEKSPMSSCKDLPLSSRSGEYSIKPVNGRESFKAYCDMKKRCGSLEGGWMRVANLNMTDSSQQCPNGFRLVTRSTAPTRTCGRTVSVGCQSVTFPVNGTKYSRVCGRVKAYQQASPDAFFRYDNSRFLDSHYVDGVSITHGTSPRTHIWTLAAAWNDGNAEYGCPCATKNYLGSVPSFIGNDYFCETGHRDNWSNVFYPDNPLWDGEGCGSESACCIFNNPPWFCKRLPQPTTDDIEVRLCADQDSSDEDTPIEAIEIYVQ